MHLVRLSKFTKPKKRKIERLNTSLSRRGNKFVVGAIFERPRIDIVGSNDFINLTFGLKAQLSTCERRNARSNIYDYYV